MSNTVELTEQEQAEENYRANAAIAAKTAYIDYQALKDAGFSAEYALDIVCSWHGRTVVNSSQQ